MNKYSGNAIQCDIQPKYKFVHGKMPFSAIFNQSQNLSMENAIQCDFQPKYKFVHRKCHSVRFSTKVTICPEYLYDTSIEKIL